MALKENKLTWAARMSLNASAIRRFTTPLIKQPPSPCKMFSSSRYVSTRLPWGQTTQGTEGTCFALIPRETQERTAAPEIICVTRREARAVGISQDSHGNSKTSRSASDTSRAPDNEIDSTRVRGHAGA